jgi:hypothetical protein
LVKAQTKNTTSFSGSKHPRFIIRTFVQLEDAVKSASGASKDSKKKLNALNAKALNAMKQKLKKWGKGDGVEAEMEEFRAVCVLSNYFLESGSGGR